MPRYFNTAGPCVAGKHYMLPPEDRLPGVPELIDEESYFVIHAPRQSGKTTSLAALARRLTAEGDYTALLTTCEAGQVAEEDFEQGIAAVIQSIEMRAQTHLPEPLRPELIEKVAHVGALTRLEMYLRLWARRSPRPVVVFFDEIDSLLGKTLISVLRQLRSGYQDRPEHFPHAVVLIGMRDVRDYRMEARGDAPTMGTASPFNIKVESLILRNFTAEEIVELYGQHTADTGQAFTADACALAAELTRGQPWLVNALARQITRFDVTDRGVRIDVGHLEAAKETVIRRRDAHLDSLLRRLREPRVRRVVESVLSGELLPEDIDEDEIHFVKDLGLVSSGSGGLQIANPLYREIIPRTLTHSSEEQLSVSQAPYVLPDGDLDFDRLLADFVAFWRANAESFLRRQPYSEAAAQLVFMGYLQKILNGGPAVPGASIDREFAVGSRRVDLLIRWPLPSAQVRRWAIELKVR